MILKVNYHQCIVQADVIGYAARLANDMYCILKFFLI